MAPGVANLAGLRECNAGRLASSLRDIVDLFSGLSSPSVADWIPRTLAASYPGHLGWRPRPDTSVAAKRAARHVLVRPRILQALLAVQVHGRWMPGTFGVHGRSIRIISLVGRS